MTSTGNRTGHGSRVRRARRGAILSLALLAPAAPGRAAPCPVIAMSTSSHEAQILVGAATLNGGRCRGVTDTDSGAGVRWLGYLRCGEAGSLSSLSPVALPSGGFPFEHDQALWLVAPDGSRRQYAARPAAPDLQAIALHLDALEGATAFVASRVDPWTWALVEQGSDVVLARWITSDGSDGEMRVARQESWTPGWPDGSALLGAGLTQETAWAFARKPDGGIATSTFPATSVPDLAASTSESAAATLVGGSPKVALASEGRLRLLTLGASGWREDVAPALQPPLSSGAAVAMSALGEQGGVVIAAWTGSALVLAVRDDSGWRLDRRAIETTQQAAVRPRTVERDPTHPGAIRWALPAMTMAIGLLAAALLWWWWRRG